MKKRHTFPFLFYGALLFIAGILTYLIGVLLGLPRHLFGLHFLLEIQELLVWYSGIPIVAGLALAGIDFLLFFNTKRFNRHLRMSPLKNRAITVALTAQNDEASIAAAVFAALGIATLLGAGAGFGF